MTTIRKLIEHIAVKVEGGYSNDPRDPGGETKYGITKRWNPKVDIKNLTLDDAVKIYEKEWYNQGYNFLWEVDCAIAYAVYNIGVNMGHGTAFILLSKAMGLKTSNAKILATALAKADDKAAVLGCFLEKARERYKSLAYEHRKVFLKGWLRRVDAIQPFLSTI